MTETLEKVLIVYATLDPSGEGTREDDITSVREIVDTFGRLTDPPDAVIDPALMIRTQAA